MMTFLVFLMVLDLATPVRDLKCGNVVRFTQTVQVVSISQGCPTSTLPEVMIVVGALEELVVQVVMKLLMVTMALLTISSMVLQEALCSVRNGTLTLHLE